MVVVGLTGGIGSGKSTVARLLAARGAVIVDADRIAAQIREPGGAAYQPLIDRFGEGIVAADGTIDRPALAAIAFADEESTKALNAITHPAIGTEIGRQIAEAAKDPGAVVVMDLPLLAEGGPNRYPLAGVVVVDTPVEVAVERLVAFRGFDEADALARVKAQATREQRRAIADVVIANGADEAALEPKVHAAWAWMRALPGGPDGPPAAAEPAPEPGGEAATS